MGVVTLEKEITVAIPPAKTFKVFVLESDTAIPSILPQAVKTVEIIEGNGGPGTIKKITFGEGGDFKYMKSKVEVVDKDTLTLLQCYWRKLLLRNKFFVLEADNAVPKNQINGFKPDS
ncbi:hypothetical protein GH714_018372 [Hevea brasiliensis]|uniref:Bet v I/Major latex protein domain-containing protein n=1 Tax=Hevea brasiliensis TaxID=3981 RepID=A0A6A6MJD5_HEVBR|nr:hypothetical protein GH714_018372 [Hevea brasiliensis]